MSAIQLFCLDDLELKILDEAAMTSKPAVTVNAESLRHLIDIYTIARSLHQANEALKSRLQRALDDVHDLERKLSNTLAETRGPRILEEAGRGMQ